MEEVDDFKAILEGLAEDLGDPRIDRTKLYSVSEILLLAFVGIIVGCEGWRSLERFGVEKIELLRKFYPYPNGTPSDDTLRRFFRRIGPQGLKTFFLDWVRSLDLPEQKFIAIDGKVSRCSIRSCGAQMSTVTAYASEHSVLLGQEKVADKSNEITAIPKLLELLDLKGAVVTIDAAGCQRTICDMIVNKKADYCIAVKGNQEVLHEEIINLFEDAYGSSETKVHSVTTTDQDHGRYEQRTYQVIKATGSKELSKLEWPGLNTVVKVISTRQVKDKQTESVRYYVSSLEVNAALHAKAIRSHWAIENGVHWLLDTVYNDDKVKIRKGNAPENMMIIKQLTLNLLKKAKTRQESIKWLRASCGWNDKTLMRVLSQLIHI